MERSGVFVISPSQNRYYPALDGIRGIAAYIVLLGHFANYTGVWSDYFSRGTGQLGVMLFFALSGFLMGSLYVESDFGYTNVKRFYIKRVARVFPLYLFIVLLSYLLYIIYGRTILFDLNETNIVNHVLFVRGVHILWTIAVEVQFYAIFPIFWIFFFYFKSKTLMGAFLFSMIALLFIVSMDARELTGHAHYFLLGILISIIPLMRGKKSNALFILSFVFFIIMIPGWPVRYEFSTLENMWFDPLYFIMTAMVIYSGVVSKLANVVLGSAVFNFLGNISYSVYIWHIPVIQFYIEIVGMSLSSRTGFIIYLTTVNIISYTSFVVIERPCRRYIHTGVQPSIRNKSMN